MLFVQAARVVLLRPADWPKHSFGRWLEAAQDEKLQSCSLEQDSK